MRKDAMKDKITIAGRVRPNDYFSDHAWFVGELTKAQFARIKRASKIVAKQQAYALSFFDGSVDSLRSLRRSVAETVDLFVGEDDDTEYMDDVPVLDAPNETECMTLNVTDSDVYWTWGEKFVDGEVETYEVPIEDLAKAFAKKQNRC